MTSQYKVFHNPCEEVRRKLHVILVRPSFGGNIGAAARAKKNMGVQGKFIVVGQRSLINDEAVKYAKHALDVLEGASFVGSLEEAKALLPKGVQFLASTARSGSSTRPHPVTAREALTAEIGKLQGEEIPGIAFVFGPESDGLSNEEVDLCDRVVTIPSSPEYRSINLSQSVLIFTYEANVLLNGPSPRLKGETDGQRERLIQNVMELAKEVGFILPGDPYKMAPHLEGIFSRLPKYIPEARTLHGLLDQVRRSVRKGTPDFKGRFLTKLKEVENVKRS